MDAWERRRPFRTTLIVVCLLVVGAVLAVGGLKVAHKVHWSEPATSVAYASAGYGLNAPTSVALVGSDLYIANELGNSVSVVNADTGVHVATISGQSLSLDAPSAVVAVGGDLFVANGAGDSVTEIDTASRSLVRTISGPQFQFSDPIALAADQGRLFVLSSSGPVTAISVASGGLVGIASGAQFGFSAPLGIAASSGRLWVTNSASNSVTEIDSQTLALVARLQQASFKFQRPTGAVLEGTNLWVTNEAGDSVTEVDTSTGQLVRVVVDHVNLPTPGPITVGDGYVFTVSPPGVSPMVSQITPDNGKVVWMMCNTNGPYLFSNPQSAVVSGSNLWIVSKGSSSLTEMDTDSGALIRTIS
jgi:DNA-binding beta-propeller fold protein YncE